MAESDFERRDDPEFRRLVEAGKIAARRVLQEYSIHDLSTHEGRQEEKKDRYHSNKVRHLCNTAKAWALKTAIGAVVVAILGAVWTGLQSKLGVIPK